jgi:hypothetical protein
MMFAAVAFGLPLVACQSCCTGCMAGGWLHNTSSLFVAYSELP